jgi:hypothetical protein
MLQLRRQISPSSHRQWLQQHEDDFERLESDLVDWQEALALAREQFRKHVYENQNVVPFDFRQHRSCLFNLLASADQLVLKYCQLMEPERVKNSVLLLDEKISELMTELYQWHAPEGFKDEVPDAFKTSMKEAMAGALLDFPSGGK